MDNSNYSFSSYPDSHDSSPRSRDIDSENPSWDELPSNYKVKFMCSYGGKIQPRPYDNQLTYVNGDTKIIAVDRAIRFSDFVSKLSSICGSDVYFKYQLPGEELDALITVTNDEDLSNMMHEYERFYRASAKPARLRIFLFQLHSATFGTSDTKSERQWFADSLNSAQIQTLDTPPAAVAETGSADFLFGFDKGISSDPPTKRHIPSPPVPHPAVPNVYPGGSDASKPDDGYLVADHHQVVVSQAEIQRQIQELQKLQIANQDNNPPIAYPGDFYRRPETFPPPPSAYWHERNVTSSGAAYSDHHLHHNHQQGQQQPIFVIPAPGAYQTASMTPGGKAYYKMPPSMVHSEQPPLYGDAPNQSSHNSPAFLQQQRMVGGAYNEGVVDGGGYAYDGAGRAVYFTGAGGGPYQVAVDGRQIWGMSEDGNMTTAPTTNTLK